MDKNELIKKIKELPVTKKAENTWVNKKYKPIILNLVEIEKVINLILESK
jgi:hypothetical protein